MKFRETSRYFLVLRGKPVNFVRQQLKYNHNVRQLVTTDTKTTKTILKFRSFPAASPSLSQPQPHHHHDLPPLPQGHQLSTDCRSSTKEEGDFIRGDDENAEELVDISTLVPHTPNPRPSETHSSTDITASSTDVAAAARGRDLGGGDHIRL